MHVDMPKAKDVLPQSQVTKGEIIIIMILE